MYVFDAHSDLLTDTADKRGKGMHGNFRRDHWPRLNDGGIKGFISVVWISPEYTGDPVGRFRELIPLSLQELEENADCLRVVTTMAEIEQAEKDGVTFAILGIEGASGFPDGLDTIRDLYAKGFRHCGLTWNEKNDFATGVRSPDVGCGLTPLGRDAAALMEELGMIIDVSHLNEKSFWDLIDATRGIVIASHSNCRSLCPDDRNITDQQIRAIVGRGGVVGLDIWGDFVRVGRQPTLDDFIDHMEHIINLAGKESVMFGFDFCDYFGKDPTTTEDKEVPIVEGLTKCEDVPGLLRALEKRGYKQADIEKFAHGNGKRMLRDILG